MYKITWDKETGGVLLHSRIVEGTLGISPRPVFWEEVDLLELNKLGWKYPHAEEPLLWAINKQYWYRGEHLFDAKGADIYTKPTLEMQQGVEPMKLLAIDVKTMLKRTPDLMFVLENEAIEFIHDTYLAYAKVNKTYETPVVVENVVNDIDNEVVNIVRQFNDAFKSITAQREIMKKLRSILWIKYSIKDNDVFEKAYQYIEMYY